MLPGLAAAIVLGLGSGAALCRFELNCYVGSLISPSKSTAEQDAELLRSLTENAPARAGRFALGLRERVVAKGFTMPTDFALAPGGQLLVSEKAGTVVEVDLATGRRRTVLDLSPKTADALFRGVMTVAVDPEFRSNRFIYVVYTLEPEGGSDTPTVARVSRFVLPPTGRARGEHVLVGSIRGVSCDELPATADCLPANVDHVGSEIVFGGDGSLYIATGDGGGHDAQREPTALRAQDEDSLAGKVLHVDRRGLGLPSNPYWDGNPRSNRSKVWATGLRNPFRLALDPRGDALVAGDVGSHGADEIDAVTRGANLGWPCLEGEARHPLYASTSTCRALFRRGIARLTPPLTTHSHLDVVVGGTFLGKPLAARVGEAYVYGSWARGWLRVLSLSKRKPYARAQVLARRLPGPVALHTGPDGALYVLCFNSGTLLRVE